MLGVKQINNMKLAMFGQLKLWAADYFNLDQWQTEKAQEPESNGIYTQDQGWNMVKLMHRLARGEKTVGDKINYCAAQEGLTDGDRLMACASYVSGYDLSDYFKAWNPGESRAILPDGSSQYSGGVSAKGLAAVAAMKLPKSDRQPWDYLHVR